MVIYKITNKINGKVYIGQTIQNLPRRWAEHIYKSGKINKPLYNSIKKYGKESFIIKEIDGANSLSELNYKEWLLIHQHNSLDRKSGYNLKEGGNNKTYSIASKSKMSKTHTEIHKNRGSENHPNSKVVINSKSGQVWGSVRLAWESNKNNINLAYSSFRNKLSGISKNNTNFKYL